MNRPRVSPEVAAILRDLFIEGKDEQAVDLLLMELGLPGGIELRGNDGGVRIVGNRFELLVPGSYNGLQVGSGSIRFTMENCTVRTFGPVFSIAQDGSGGTDIMIRGCLITDRLVHACTRCSPPPMRPQYEGPDPEDGG